MKTAAMIMKWMTKTTIDAGWIIWFVMMVMMMTRTIKTA